MTFQFASPWLLALLLVIPLLLVRSWRTKPASLRYADTRLVIPQAARSWRIILMPLLTALRLVAIALIVIALARPQLTEGIETIKGEGVDIVLALDISGSMSSLDFQPDNRLQAAQKVIADFIDERHYDRVGLVVFASEAFDQSPLTIDHDVLLRLLDQIDLAPNLGLTDGTAIGLGLANAANMLKDSPSDSKVLILLTDGVNNAGQIDPQTAAEAAQTLGIKVYTIGMGKTGQVPVPVGTVFGRQVIYQESDLDEATLQQIADTTGGQYFRAEDTDALQHVYDEINQLEKSDIEVRVYNRYTELMGWFLFPAIALLLLEITLRHTLLRRIP